ncbi:sortase [Candidatus Dependentiae bacterium]|nr:sortase [Candidatus Dependentiae bacterium]
MHKKFSKILIYFQVFSFSLGLIFLVKPIYHWSRQKILLVRAKVIWVKWKNSNPSSGETSVSPEVWLKAGKINTLVIRDATKDNLLKFPSLLINKYRLKNSYGTKIIMAHRDIHFRALGDIEVGDNIEIEFKDSTIKTYTVFKTEIIDKDKIETHLNQDTPEDILVLLTCYPFYYIGPAPKRYLVYSKSGLQKSD